MIHIKVLGAENLPITKGGWKPKIYCFSISSGRYYYNSFKSAKNTDKPEWNGEFNIDLFRSINLKFYIFSSRLGSQNILIGTVKIPLSQLLSKGQIILSSNSTMPINFPIKTSQSKSARLFLTFSYSPKIFYSIHLKKPSKSILHVWLSFNPPIKDEKVEIELLQSYEFDSQNKRGIYYNFNSNSSWETVGYSSNNNYLYGPTGSTQIHSLLPERIEGKYNFFIINNANYSGIITLNFIGEQKEKIKVFRNGNYYVPKKGEIGIIQKFDLTCKPNNKYCAPFYLYYHKNHKNPLEFGSFKVMKIKKTKDYSSKNDYEFHKKIIEKAKNVISDWKNVNFIRTNVLTNNHPISLNQVLKDFNLQIDTNLRIYVGGLTKKNYTDTSFFDYWMPEFIVYDIPTNTRQPEIPKELKMKPNMKIADNDPPFYGFKWNSFVNINLDKIGNEKVIVFVVYCSAYLEAETSNSFFLISHIDGDKETLIFRCPIFPDGYHTHFEVLFRFEYINNEWCIVPMKFYFKKSLKMKSVLDAMYCNNWILPDSLKYKVDVPYSISEKCKEEFTI